MAVALSCIALIVAGCSSNSSSAGKGNSQSEAERTKQAILRVLKQDEQYSKQRDAVPRDATPSQIARQLVRLP
jgi:hypothetical protein